MAGGLFTNEAHAQGKQQQDLNSLIKSFMAEPLTSRSVLEKDADEMRTKMELLIMRIQVNTYLICQLLPQNIQSFKY